jgi:hypothetical protein
MDSGANVQQWDCWHGPNQQWHVERVKYELGETWYRIRNRNSGKCLDVWGLSHDNGANIQQWDCWDGPNQLWAFGGTSGGYSIWSRNSYDFEGDMNVQCVDVWGLSRDNGANVQQWDFWYGPNQEWNWVDVYVP